MTVTVSRAGGSASGFSVRTSVCVAARDGLSCSAWPSASPAANTTTSTIARPEAQQPRAASAAAASGLASAACSRRRSGLVVLRAARVEVEGGVGGDRQPGRPLRLGGGSSATTLAAPTLGAPVLGGELGEREDGTDPPAELAP